MTECITDMVQSEALRQSAVTADVDAHPPVTCCVWWNTEAAEKGTPWAVRHHDGTVSYFAAIRIVGTVEFVLRDPDNLLELPGGPRGVAVLIDGTLLGGR